MTQDEFIDAALSKGLVTNEKVTFQYAPIGQNAIVFSLERVGYQQTRYEVSCLLSDAEAIERGLADMAARKETLEAFTDEDLAALESPRRPVMPGRPPVRRPV